MAKLHEMLKEMEEKMNRFDLSDDYLQANGHPTRQIGEYGYGVSMVPCDWVYPYLQALATDERLSGIVEAVEEMMEE